MPNDFKGFVAKCDEKTGAFLSLRDHSADVAAVVRRLLEVSLIRKRLARLGGLDDLNDAQVDALCFFAALHDLGKVSIRFQLGIRKKFRGSGPWGHQHGALQLLYEFAHPDLPKLLSRIPAHLIGAEDGVGDALWPLRAFLICTVCHHGEPRKTEPEPLHDCWQPTHGLNPDRELRDLIDQARSWFPKVDKPEARLPYGPPEATQRKPKPWDRPQTAFLHGWNALLTLADWIGSTQKFFPYDHQGSDRYIWALEQAAAAVRDVGLDVAPTRSRLPQVLTFQEVFQLTPRPAQAQIAELPIASGGSTVVLEAGTGTGKTEAALWHFARLFEAGAVDGFYFALPTRSAATQIQRRIERFVQTQWLPGVPDDLRPAVIQAVPGYLRADGEDGTLVSRFEVDWMEDREQEKDQRKASRRLGRRAWPAERSKRYTAGAFVVGTIDQILMSALKVKHAHLRLAGLLRHLIIIDEVHASNSYMGRILEAVLLRHRQAGGHALLMSATLGACARAQFLQPERRRKDVKVGFDEAVAFPYPMIQMQTGDGEPGPPIEIRLTKKQKQELRKVVELRPEGQKMIDEPKKIAQLALNAAEQGAKVLIIRNTVKGCLAVQGALENLGAERLLSVRHAETGESILAPHHSRFDRESRRALDRAVEAAFHPDPEKRLEGGLIVVATQTVEQSLDIDADFLITDLCPMDVLLQRIGRLHRHDLEDRPEGFEAPQLIVLTPDSALSELIRESGKTYGVHGLGGLVYHDLRVLEATRRTLADCNGQLDLPEECRRLVELSTHPDILDQIGREHPDLEPRWKQHRHNVFGKELQERNVGKNALMPWGTEFGAFELNLDLEGKIQTRLGARDILVQIPGPPIGPFGLPVKELAIKPYEIGDRELPEGEVVAENVAVEADGAISFEFCGLRFRYGRLGIRVEA